MAGTAEGSGARVSSRSLGSEGLPGDDKMEVLHSLPGTPVWDLSSEGTTGHSSLVGPRALPGQSLQRTGPQTPQSRAGTVRGPGLSANADRRVAGPGHHVQPALSAEVHTAEWHGDPGLRLQFPSYLAPRSN